MTVDTGKKKETNGKIVYGPSGYWPLNLIRIGVACMRDRTFREEIDGRFLLIYGLYSYGFG